MVQKLVDWFVRLTDDSRLPQYNPKANDSGMTELTVTPFDHCFIMPCYALVGLNKWGLVKLLGDMRNMSYYYRSFS